ncbi:MAG: VWA domain-containing protein [Alphaproteobacteria bacterium]|jgi:hypothetical protein
MHFARVLRAAGLPVGPGRALEGVRAVIAAGVGSRQDFYWTLFSVFVNRQDHRVLFDQAFHVFWRNPRILERMLHALMPQVQVEADESRNEAISRRVAEALAKGEGAEEPQEGAEEEIEFDAALTYSAREVLQEMDFEAMSTNEVAQARAIISRMRLPIMAVPTRRFGADPRGRRVDMRATLRAALRSGGGVPLRHRSPKYRHPPLVVLCDISGSMSRYSRLFLHFMHAITNDRDRVHTFVFGTRLTNITRHLRHRDVDVALEKVSGGVEDWSGGTRIGHCLHDFNANWSRRVLGQGAVVLMISDGLDRDAGEGIANEIQRLHKSCRRLIWLNPLLRYDGFEPKSKGIKALLPHVDDFRTVHNLASLGDLADALSKPQNKRMEAA